MGGKKNKRKNRRITLPGIGKRAAEHTRAVEERKRSNAAGTHASTPNRERTRGDALRAAKRDQGL